MEVSTYYASDPNNLAAIPGNKIKNSTKLQTMNQEPSYIIAHTLHAVNPDAKYIIMLRNPILR